MVNRYILKLKMSKLFKSVELVIVMVLGSVEDERTIFIFTFMKSNLKNQLITHLDLVVRMYAQDFFTFQSFSFYIVIT